VVVGDRVVFADRSGSVFALDASTGRVLWHWSGLDRPAAGIAAVDTTLYLVVGDQTLVALDARTGKQRSRLSLERGPYGGRMMAVGDSLLLLLGERSFTSVDLKRGAVRWARPDSAWSSSRPYVWRDMALAGTGGGKLYAMAIADGSVRWMHTLPGVPRGIGTHGDTLYVGTLGGRVHALVDTGTVSRGR
jgi:outer membrane protein assembly factor BamB